MKKFSLFLLTGLITVVNLPLSAQQDSTATTPKLVVVLVIDQMRPDFLSRFNQYYTGGFRRLIDHGFVFDSATQDHACTETGPGYVTIGTGRIPAKHGIIANDWYLRPQKRLITDSTPKDTSTYMNCVQDTSAKIVGYPDYEGRSPKNIITDGFSDWLKRKSPGSKVFSLALKDRSAIGLGGRHPDAVVWWNRNSGDFVTSTYYSDTLPAWVAAFNQRHVFDTLRNKQWKKGFPDSCYLLSTFDSFPGENNGPDLQNSFPHDLPWDSTKVKPFYKTFLYVSPFVDEALLNLGKEVVSSQLLGADSIPDLLCIGLSSSDAIGHTFGPNSQEVEDYYLRLDQKLGTFFAFLDQTVGEQSYLVAVSADHGVLPLPEYLEMFGIESERILTETMESDLKQITTRMEAEGFGKASWFKGYPQEIYLVPDTIIADTTKTNLVNHLKNEVLLLPYVEDAYTRNEIKSPKTKDRPYLSFYKNGFYADRFSDLIVRYKENLLVFASQYGTTHGSPYYYDRHVPLLFCGMNIKPGTSYEPVRTVDLAATIATMLHVPVPADADGKSLLDKMK